MVTSEQFNLAAVQAVIFTPDESQFSQSSILAAILGQYAERYNGDVQTLPLLDQMPSEFPRVILQSADEVFKFQAGPARIDSFWNAKEGQEYDAAFTSTEVLEQYIRNAKTSIQVGRLALVIT